MKRYLAITLAFLFVPGAVLARPPLILDFISFIDGTLSSRDLGGDNNSHDTEVFKFTPLADVGMCEMDTSWRQNGNNPVGTLTLKVIASPSTDFFYSFRADAPLTVDSWTTTYQLRTHTFYDGIEITGAGTDIGSLNLTPGTCPVMYGGHQYWIKFTASITPGNSRVEHQFWTDRDISAYTLYAFHNSDTGVWVQNSGQEWNAKAYGYSTFPYLPGSLQYESANPAQWVTSASYNFETADFGRLGNMFRDVIVFAFFPSDTSMAQFASLSFDFSSKPPLGYFTLIKNAFTGVATSSETADTYLAHQTIRDLTDPFRTGLTMLLWLLFGWYLWKRFIHFKL